MMSEQPSLSSMVDVKSDVAMDGEHINSLMEVKAVELEEVLTRGAYMLFYARNSIIPRDPRKPKNPTSKSRSHSTGPLDVSIGTECSYLNHTGFQMIKGMKWPILQEKLMMLALNVHSSITAVIRIKWVSWLCPSTGKLKLIAAVYASSGLLFSCCSCFSWILSCLPSSASAASTASDGPLFAAAGTDFLFQPDSHS
ncbi:unnamed protein product [Ilex paraguariensis]|uniref:Uncharacterized protein n=1 Tax=Ilex paraguariensis TaxID=185542 RepID=A0ABC8S7J0_9AQUA